MSLLIPYNECHSNLTPEQNKAALEKVAEIIKINQLRSVGHERNNNNLCSCGDVLHIQTD